MKPLPLRKYVLFVAVLLGLSTSVHAVSVTLHSSNQGIASINVIENGTTITIQENWSGTGQGVLLISGLEANVVYTVVKVITNNSGVDWTRLANELLDPIGGQGFDGTDPNPQPAFVPAGFSTSNDNDGLSFGQGFGLPRTSTVFPSIIVDEATDVRDYIDFFGATLSGAGGVDTAMTYGLTDTLAVNQPFLLMQRPNVESRPTGVPDSGTTLSLLAFSLLALALLKRKQ